MNYVLIFKNEVALKRAGIDISSLSCPVSIDSHTRVYLYDDTQSFDQIKKTFNEALQKEGNTFYVILHENPQRNMLNTFKNEFGQNVILQSHTGGGFYFTILPKLIKNSCTLDDIKNFFPNVKKSLLCKLFVGDFELSKEESDLIATINFDLEKFKNDYDTNIDFESLELLRKDIYEIKE